jgi:uncharacterized damage-inducible protein DinB
MKPDDILTMLYRHNLWANLRLLERCAELTSEQMDARIPGSRGSIHDTLQHIVTAEQSYFSRISTGQPTRRRGEAPPMTIAEIMGWYLGGVSWRGIMSGIDVCERSR